MPKAIEKRLAEIRKQARKGGVILLRCPHCRHYLTGIISPRGDFMHRGGERSNLYCTWPHCTRKDERVKMRDAVRGRGPRDGTKCCNRPRHRRGRAAL